MPHDGDIDVPAGADPTTAWTSFTVTNKDGSTEQVQLDSVAVYSAVLTYTDGTVANDAVSDTVADASTNRCPTAFWDAFFAKSGPT